jgi:peptidoglycan hydrolase-like protein with peptidoglycan-binding domain
MADMLRQGSTGPRVQELQQILNYLADPSDTPLEVDGIFGPQTKEWVVAFQESWNLSPDGIVGPLTSTGLLNAVFWEMTA